MGVISVEYGTYSLQEKVQVQKHFELAEPLKHQKGRKQDGGYFMIDIGMVRVRYSTIISPF